SRIMLYLLVILPILISAIKPEFDNSLTTAPTVICERGSMSLDISSSHGAPSVVFAKGHFNKEGCSFRNATHVTFDFEKCNVRRKREINPRRMVYSTTVVVQLHPLFITKVDRAYAVSCNYMEAEKNVGAGITVSELTTELLSHEREQPTCTYSLKKDSPNGPNIKVASVGDSIYHVWECPSEIYAMLVHSCVVQDGQGQEQKVMDENG
ncbi:cutl-16, partial [Pristionchus pacificus]